MEVGNARGDRSDRLRVPEQERRRMLRGDTDKGGEEVRCKRDAKGEGR